MKFELTRYNRNVSEEELLSDMKRVSDSFGGIMTRNNYNTHGAYSASTIAKRFGGWNNALIKIGTDPKVLVGTVITKEEIIADLQRVANSIGEQLTVDVYGTLGKYHPTTCIKKFRGWNKALEQAGLTPTQIKLRTDEELFENLEEVWVKLGRQPMYRDMHEPLSVCSAKPYVNRFGSWMKALEAFVENANSEKAEEINAEPVAIKKPDTKGFVHKTKRDVGWRLRFLVFSRDKFRCLSCGRSPANTPGAILHADHIIPYSKGGETVIDNLQTLCEKCNIGKGDLE